jgi:hypothetical protein
MDEKNADESDRVTISVELDGKYDDVMAKLQTEATGSENLAPLAQDIRTVLDTLEEINGGTRSAIAQALPADCSLAGNPDAVVDLMQVLERYDLVTLEGNTWLPAPAAGDR